MEFLNELAERDISTINLSCLSKNNPAHELASSLLQAIDESSNVEDISLQELRTLIQGYKENNGSMKFKRYIEGKFPGSSLAESVAAFVNRVLELAENVFFSEDKGEKDKSSEKTRLAKLYYLFLDLLKEKLHLDEEGDYTKFWITIVMAQAKEEINPLINVQQDKLIQMVKRDDAEKESYQAKGISKEEIVKRINEVNVDLTSLKKELETLQKTLKEKNEENENEITILEQKHHQGLDNKINELRTRKEKLQLCEDGEISNAEVTAFCRESNSSWFGWTFMVARNSIAGIAANLLPVVEVSPRREMISSLEGQIAEIEKEKEQRQGLYSTKHQELLEKRKTLCEEQGKITPVVTMIKSAIRTQAMQEIDGIVENCGKVLNSRFWNLVTSKKSKEALGKLKEKLTELRPKIQNIKEIHEKTTDALSESRKKRRINAVKRAVFLKRN